MLSDNGHISRNGSKRDIYSNDSVHKRSYNNYIPDRKTSSKRVETKLILGILAGTGVASYIAAILLNLGTWKADILFVIAVLFGVLGAIRRAVKTWHEYKKGELEIKAMKKKQDDEIFS